MNMAINTSTTLLVPLPLKIMSNKELVTLELSYVFVRDGSIHA